MRLTPELIKESLSYINPLKERELDLRGHRIPAIENLAVAGPHDAIDFTDNDIQILGNFPLSPRLTTLLFARNRISHIQPSFCKNVPFLQNLLLASNNIAELADLDALAGFRRLTHLVLVDNPVTKKEHYRYWMLWRCPSLRFIDYVKVKNAERERATELFGTNSEPTELALKIVGSKSLDADPSAALGAGEPRSRLKQMKLSEPEKKRLKEMIRKADSLEEMIRLETMLKEGRLPAGVHNTDGLMEE